jgi:hypothetical protein
VVAMVLVRSNRSIRFRHNLIKCANYGELLEATAIFRWWQQLMNLRAKMSEHVKHIYKLKGMIVYKKTGMVMDAIAWKISLRIRHRNEFL